MPSATLEATPEGGQLATLEAGTSGRVVGRAGDWVRVQFEGWVRSSDLKPAADGALVLVRLAASHFLWKMVRRIVGVLAALMYLSGDWFQ